MSIRCRNCGGAHLTVKCPEGMEMASTSKGSDEASYAGVDPLLHPAPVPGRGRREPRAELTSRGQGQAKHFSYRGGGNENGQSKHIQDEEGYAAKVCPSRLLLAWTHLELSSLGDSACKTERNDITHLMERPQRCFNLSDGVLKKYSFPRFQSEYNNLKLQANLDTDRVHAVVFIRLLALVREFLYNQFDEFGGEMRQCEQLNAALAQHNIDIKQIMLQLKGLGLDVMKFKRINRLRNAFKKQTAKRWHITKGMASHIATELNDLCIEEEDNFVTELQKLMGNSDINRDTMLDTLHEDDALERGKTQAASGAMENRKRLEEPDVNVMQLLHTLHKAWFTVRGPPRNVGLEDITANALKAACVCDGALLDMHRALACVRPKSAFANIAQLPDIGDVIEESLFTFRKAKLEKLCCRLFICLSQPVYTHLASAVCQLGPSGRRPPFPQGPVCATGSRP